MDAHEAPSRDTMWDTDRLRGMLGGFALAPAVVAAGVAGLYIIGALLLSAQLVGAHVSVTDTLRLIPLEQVLARGVGTVVLASVALPAYVLVLILGIRRERHMKVQRATEKTERARAAAEFEAARQAGDRERAQRVLDQMDAHVQDVSRRLRKLKWLMSITFGCTLVVLAFSPPEVWVLAGLLFAYLALATKYPTLRPRSILAIYLGVVGTAILVSLAFAFIRPEPFPSARVVLTDNAVLRGDLIVHGDGVWVLDAAPQRIVAVGDGSVGRVIIQQRKRSGWSMWEVVTGHRPPRL
jgi:hypothetical protein